MVKPKGLGGSVEFNAMVKREQSDECKVSSIDRINELPDELLGFILSLLTLKEAMAASIVIVCRRWKYIWTTSLTKLDFEATESLHKIMVSRHKSVLNKKRLNYVRWVDRVVAACSSSTSIASHLKEFRIFFDLTSDSAKHIDEWLRFAVSRKVERLELSFTDKWLHGSRRKYEECYTFPYGKGNFPNGFSFIKKLTTHFVNVSGEALEFFLGNCPLLEQLSVSGSGLLQGLDIDGTFPAFKCLEISLCHNLKSVVVNSKLVSLKYSGMIIRRFQLLNVPFLTEIWLAGYITNNRAKFVVEMFSDVLPQIERFKIYFFCKSKWKETENLLSTFTNLKELVVNIGIKHNASRSLLPLIYLMNASPNLERFVLETQRVIRKIKHHNRRRSRKNIPSINAHLKEVEFVGYHGVDCQLELVEHLVKDVATLEKMIVDTRGFSSCELDRCWIRVPQPAIDEEEQLRYASQQVKMATAYDANEQLRKYVPSRINMKII